MKKWRALLLSVIMAASLAVPAFAAEPQAAPVDGDPDFFTENGLPVPVYTPGSPIPINAILDDESIGIIGGQDGPTAIITTPIPGLDPDMTWEELLQQQQQQFIDQEKAALGGVPGQIGVMVNGEYVKFPDAVPEIKNGCTMVPIRALAEVLGGNVAYGEEEKTQLVSTFDWPRLTFTVGKAEVIVEYSAGKGEVLPLDCAPYIKDGRAYVPLRFMGEILGYEVGWDSDFQTAILLDRAALAAEFDKDFTIMNKVQASRVSGWEKGKNLNTGVKGNVSVTAFDTLNGNKTYKVDFSSQVLMDREAANGSFSIKLSDNIAALLAGQYGDLDEEILERLNLMVKALENADFIMNRDGQMWVKSPVLDELGGVKDIWCGMELDEMETQTVFVDSDAATIGSVLAQLASTDSVMMWSQAGMMVAAMELYRDENFTTSGGISTLTLGVEDLAGVYEAMTGSGALVDEALDVFKEYKIVVKVDSRGGATVTCTMETKAQPGLPAMKMTMDCTQSGGKADLTVDVHVANIGEMKLTLNTIQRTTSEKPIAEPPAGANVVDAPALLEEFVNEGYSSEQ